MATSPPISAVSAPSFPPPPVSGLAFVSPSPPISGLAAPFDCQAGPTGPTFSIGWLQCFFYRKFAFFQLELLEFFGIFGVCFVILNKISNFELLKKKSSKFFFKNCLVARVGPNVIFHVPSVVPFLWCGMFCHQQHCHAF